MPLFQVIGKMNLLVLLTEVDTASLPCKVEKASSGCQVDAGAPFLMLSDADSNLLVFYCSCLAETKRTTACKENGTKPTGPRHQFSWPC
jgi:hypothetical protein